MHAFNRLMDGIVGKTYPAHTTGLVDDDNEVFADALEEQVPYAELPIMNGHRI
jgi:hypothetical protein